MNTSHQEVINHYRTRSALEELPSTYEVTRIPIPPNLQATPQANNNAESLAATNSPSPSPDELIIRDRGRRSLPVKWSPIPIASPQKLPERLPLKRTATKGIIALRSSPRKKLLLTDTSELEQSRKALLQSSPLARSNSSVILNSHNLSPEDTIKSLSQNQLVDVLTTILQKHPEIKDEVSRILPHPDMKAMEEELSQYKKSIFKSLPTSRLTSKTDSPAFCRALPHINAFKKLLQNHCKQFSDSSNWECLLSYSLLAWGYVRSTPIWDSSSHNNSSRKACYKMLAQSCLLALKNSTLDGEDQLDALTKQLEPYTTDCDEMKDCLDYIRQMHNNN